MKYLFTCITLSLVSSVFAQTYKGTVRNSQGSPIAYANVVVKSSDKGVEDAVITGVITDEDGKFALSVEHEGSMVLSISFIGYATRSIELGKSLDTDLGTITLQESQSELDEVVVAGKAPVITREADRLVFNVQSSTVSQGFNATEVIKNVPRIDPTSDQLKIIGKSSVMVLINDKLINLNGSDLTTYLKSIRSEDIARIEVMTTPPAKYDAASNSGLINIVLKKNVDLGFDGTVSSTYIQRTKPGIMPSASLRYSTKRLSTSLNIFADQETKIYDTDIDIDYATLTRRSIVKREDDIMGLSAGLTMDYQLSDNARAGVVLNGSYWDTEQTTASQVFFENSSQKVDSNQNLPFQEVDSTQNLPSINNNRYDYLAISAYYDVKLDTLGKTLKFNYNRLQKGNEDDRDFISESFDGNFETRTKKTSATNVGNADYTATSINADLELPFEGYRIEVGGKWTRLGNNSEIRFFDTTSDTPVLDASQSNDFTYNETIWASYVSFEKSWGEKFYSKVGLRYETTSTEGRPSGQDDTNAITNRFDNIFPSIFLSYELNESHSFSLAYNKRIDRPIFYDVNPFRTYIDFYNYIQGNPSLMPSLTHNVEASYMFKNNLSFTAYASFLKDGSEYITITSEDDLFIVSRPENYYNQDTYGLDISYSFEPFKNFSSYSSFSAYYNSSESQLTQLTIPELQGYGYFFSTRNSWAFNKERNNSLYLNFYQKFPSTEGLANISNRASLQLGCVMNFLDQKLAMNVSVSDIFRQSFTKTTEKYPGFTWNSKQYSDQQNLNITLTYKFGNNKSRNVNRNIDDSDKSRFNQ